MDYNFREQRSLTFNEHEDYRTRLCKWQPLRDVFHSGGTPRSGGTGHHDATNRIQNHHWANIDMLLEFKKHMNGSKDTETKP
jgi:hypothetical protein